MAKRLTDSNKWDKPWYRKLPSEYKCFWDFILSKCDLAGVWDVDFDGASYHIGSKIIPAKAQEFFADQIEFLSPKKWLILDFVIFQYGYPLNSKSPIHKKVNEILTRYDLHCTLHNRVACRIKDKEEDKEEVKEEDKEVTSPEDFVCEQVVEFLNRESGSFYRKSGSKTKTLIKARIKEGFTLENFQQVIIHKVATWGNDPKMKEYLRPETLFGSKFESYLNVARSPAPKNQVEQKLTALEQVKQHYQNEPSNHTGSY